MNSNFVGVLKVTVYGIIFVTLFSACGGGSGEGSEVTTNTNNAPLAFDLIINHNGSFGPEVGMTLTADYQYSDTENDPEGNSQIQWFRNSQPIENKTSINYIVVREDSEQSIFVEVTPIASRGTAQGATVRSQPVDVINQQPLAVNVDIVDDNQGYSVIGDRLTASYNFIDRDGDEEGESTFQWLRDNETIENANLLNYILTEQDVPTRITFEVAPLSKSGVIEGEPSLSNELSTGTPPMIVGVKYTDTDDQSHNLKIVFDQSVVIDEGNVENFYLPNELDSFGDNARTTTGTNNTVSIWLGSNHKIITVGVYSKSANNQSASGLNLESDLAEGLIKGISGINVGVSEDFDIVSNFHFHSESGVPKNSTALAIGDIDGNGINDVVVANYQQANQVYTSNILFNDASQELGDASSTDVAIGDIDGDGDLDLVFSNDLEPSNIYFNSGFGAFPVTAQLPETMSSKGVILLDIDNDLDLDLIVINSDSPNQIYLNNGAGVYTNANRSFGVGNSYGIATADLDGDGDSDFVIANYGLANRIYLNDGAGNFIDSAQRLGDSLSRSVSIVDIDADGFLDLVFANYGQENKIYINDGKANFTDSGQKLGNKNSSDVATLDFDGDGRIDLVFVNENQENNLYSQDLSGVFKKTVSLPMKKDSRTIGALDFDRDGDIDIIVGNYLDTYSIMLNSLAGSNSRVQYVDSGQELDNSSSEKILLGDLNNNGFLDLVISNSRESNRIYINDGNGVFINTDQEFPENINGEIALADIDSDGDLDLIEVNQSAEEQSNRIYLNDGSAIFTDSGQNIGNWSSTDVTMVDVDLDGDLDMVVANPETSNHLYINDNGIFSDSGQVLAGSVVIDSGDVDGDGDPDLIFAGLNQLVQLYENNGSGVFSIKSDFSNSFFIRDIEFADMDSDGDLDLVTATNESIKIYFNDGKGSFKDSGQNLAGSNSFKLNDLDGDGHVDLVLVGFGTTKKIFINNGEGLLMKTNSIILDDNIQGLALGDVDGDGDIDIALARSGQRPSKIYLNQ